jgi:hypothetical protein
MIQKPLNHKMMPSIGMKIIRQNIKSANVVAFNNETGQYEYDFFK